MKRIRRGMMLGFALLATPASWLPPLSWPSPPASPVPLPARRRQPVGSRPAS